MAEDGVAREPGETPVVACKKGEREMRHWRKLQRDGREQGARQLWFPCQIRRKDGGDDDGRTWGRTGEAKVEGET